MKKIVFVKNLNSEADIEKIEMALCDTRANYSISLERKAVVIEGNNDIQYAVKVALREVGYIIE